MMARRTPQHEHTSELPRRHLVDGIQRGARHQVRDRRALFADRRVHHIDEGLAVFAGPLQSIDIRGLVDPLDHLAFGGIKRGVFEPVPHAGVVQVLDHRAQAIRPLGMALARIVIEKPLVVVQADTHRITLHFVTYQSIRSSTSGDNSR